MKKLLCLALSVILAATLLCSLVSCGKSDWKEIEEKGRFVCGITYYEPMNYFDENGDLVGFDTEFAQAVAKELGVEVKFQLISWDAKYTELNSGAIDAIWNGFTRGDEDGVSRAEYVDFSYDYLNNSQCIVMKADAVASYTTIESLANLKGMAEAGSAGEAVAKDATEDYTAAPSQADALMEL
ncbi:MAG: transporter substrate-binding domain-containing protein, partial [Eubacteriales bacterium]